MKAIDIDDDPIDDPIDPDRAIDVNWRRYFADVANREKEHFSYPSAYTEPEPSMPPYWLRFRVFDVAGTVRTRSCIMGKN